MIVVCNLFPIVQLAGRGHFLKRRCYLLINLASADIVMGACAVSMFGCLVGGQHEARTFSQLWKAGLGLILSLTSVSLERLSATLWPLRLMNIWLRNASSLTTFWTKPGVLSVSVTWFQ